MDGDACEFVFIGELRWLKGVDVFLKALSHVSDARPVKAFIAGGGPDEKKFKKLARSLGLENSVTFAGPTPARAAFARGQCLVVPSRAESLPYIVLEAAAAGLPLIATDVGGIPEIVEGSDVRLIPADDVTALTQEMASFLRESAKYAETASQLQKIVSKRFNVRDMARSVTHFYVSRLVDR